MKTTHYRPGDLVYHRDDIRDGINGPVPGLIVRLTNDIYDRAEAIVYFTDRTFGEYHPLSDLIKVEVHEGESNDYRRFG